MVPLRNTLGESQRDNVQGVHGRVSGWVGAKWSVEL